VNEFRAWACRLEELGLAIQRHLRDVLRDADDDLASPVAQEGGDTIFAIDRHVEKTIENEVEGWPSECKPLLLVAEGLGENGRRIVGPADQALRYRVIVDPIDGTRNLMYDKRSAWFIAAVAPDRGEDTSLADVFSAVLLELPTSKQVLCDSFVAVTGEPTIGRRRNVDGGEAKGLDFRPSQAATLEFGFAQVSNFFPGTKVLASELMERIVAETVGEVRPGSASVFDDQYITSGGQMVELIVGHDRFCCDLRPLFYEILDKQCGQTVRGLECHPYDVAGALVAQQAGVVVTDGFGRRLDVPLNVDTGVHWCGYANESLRQQIAPVIKMWLKEHGVAPY
jgi:fructose-1,6-bisphosphatase/inositol monophosphatase family enzyme